MVKLVILWRDAPTEELVVRTVTSAKLHGEATHKAHGSHIVSIYVFHTKWIEDVMYYDKTKPYYRLMKKGGWAQL